MLFSVCSVSVSLTPKASLLCVDINKFCSPTRTSLQSGRWAYNLGTSSGIIDNGHPANLPLSESTVADELAELGYRNYAIGKCEGSLRPYHPGDPLWSQVDSGNVFFRSELDADTPLVR